MSGVILSEGSVQGPLALSVYEAVLKAACFLEGVQEPCFATLKITDASEIKSINHAWRGMNKSTDVLSFPSLPLLPDHTLGKCRDQLETVWDADQNAYFLGDIFICLEKALSQAADFGHCANRELAYLFTHAVLHLMGYDHQELKDQKAMREKEEQVLAATGAGLPDDKELLKRAILARKQAYTPYSNYKVGAALLADNGVIYTGCNVENASFGLTNCAERTALFKAVSEGSTSFSAIAIAADATAPWPCGACRQVLSEFAPGLRVLITWDNGRKTDQTTLDQLLPHSFRGFKEDGQ